LELLERIAQMEDPKLIKKLMMYMDEALTSTQIPSKETLMARAKAGQARIEAGQFVTLDEAFEGLDAAHVLGQQWVNSTYEKK